MDGKQRPLGRPRQIEQTKPTNKLILDVATGMFLDKGYPLVSMDDVAKKCDVTKATVYYYYKTKEDLFTEAMVQLLDRIKQMISAISSTDKPLKDQLFKLAKGHLQATVDIDINGIMKEAKTSLSNEHLQLMEAAEEKMYAALEQAIKFAMEKGEVPQGNPRLGAHIFVMMLTLGSTINITEKGTFSSLDEMIEQLLDFYWNGLGN